MVPECSYVCLCELRWTFFKSHLCHSERDINGFIHCTRTASMQPKIAWKISLKKNEMKISSLKRACVITFFRFMKNYEKRFEDIKKKPFNLILCFLLGSAWIFNYGFGLFLPFVLPLFWLIMHFRQLLFDCFFPSLAETLKFDSSKKNQESKREKK